MLRRRQLWRKVIVACGVTSGDNSRLRWRKKSGVCGIGLAGELALEVPVNQSRMKWWACLRQRPRPTSRIEAALVEVKIRGNRLFLRWCVRSTHAYCWRGAKGRAHVYRVCSCIALGAWRNCGLVLVACQLRHGAIDGMVYVARGRCAWPLCGQRSRERALFHLCHGYAQPVYANTLTCLYKIIWLWYKRGVGVTNKPVYNRNLVCVFHYKSLRRKNSTGYVTIEKKRFMVAAVLNRVYSYN